MIITKVICDKCGKEIKDSDPSISLDMKIVFDKGDEMAHLGKNYEGQFCKECGRDWLLNTLPKRAAAERIRDWTGEVLVSGGSEVLG